MKKIGIIGAGRMGRVHARAYRSVRGAWVTGVFDTDADAAQALARQCSAEPFGAIEHILDSDAEIIDICTPTHEHAAAARAAFAAGKHVIIEAPMAREAADARALIEAAHAARRSLFACAPARYSHPYFALRQALEARAAGRIRLVRMSRTAPHPGGWCGKRSQSGGVILDLGIHDVDFLLWCFGPPARVYAHAVSQNRARYGRDYALATLAWPDRMLAHMELSWAHAGASEQVEAAGDGGALHFASEDSSTVRLMPTGHTSRPVEYETPTVDPLWEAQLGHFLDCLDSGTAPRGTPEDAIRALDVSLAMIESAEKNEAVALNHERKGKASAGGRKKKKG
jgi:UDP-N-acetylglucosamine 3-dehydrogenase